MGEAEPASIRERAVCWSLLNDGCAAATVHWDTSIPMKPTSVHPFQFLEKESVFLASLLSETLNAALNMTTAGENFAGLCL